MPTDFTNERQANLVVNPQADLAEAPASDLYRGPEGQATRPAYVSVVPLLNDLAWENRPVSEGVYTDYRITLRIEEDNQTAELAPQEAEDTDVYQVEYVQLSKPTLRLIAEWSAERAGQPPTNPAKDLGDTNAVYLGGSWNPGGLELASDGYTFLYQTAGRYEYGFKRPKLAKFGAGIPPWASALMGLGDRPFIYGTPNVSGIFPGFTSALQTTNAIAPTLPGVPTGEGQPGTQLGATLATTGASLSDADRVVLDWITGQRGGPSLTPPFSGGGQ